jgi:hypothetical protein
MADYVIPSDNIQVRWKEQYVSAAVNRMFAGHYQSGVWRGFVAQVGIVPSKIELVPDVTKGDSVASYEDPDGYVLNCRLTDTIEIDFTGKVADTYYIVLQMNYDINYETVGEINAVTSVGANDVIIAKVVLNGTVITSVEQVPNVSMSVPVHNTIYPLSAGDYRVNIGSKDSWWWGGNIYTVTGKSSPAGCEQMIGSNFYWNGANWAYQQGTVAEPMYAARFRTSVSKDNLRWDWLYATPGVKDGPITAWLSAISLIYKSDTPGNYYMEFNPRALLPRSGDIGNLGDASYRWNTVYAIKLNLAPSSGGTDSRLEGYASGIGCGSHFNPIAQDSYDFGTSSQRWRNVYALSLNLSSASSGPQSILAGTATGINCNANFYPTAGYLLGDASHRWILYANEIYGYWAGFQGNISWGSPVYCVGGSASDIYWGSNIYYNGPANKYYYKSAGTNYATVLQTNYSFQGAAIRISVAGSQDTEVTWARSYYFTPAAFYASEDAVVDLGTNSSRWKNLFLSGGAYLYDLYISHYIYSNLVPYNPITIDLGSSDRKWRTLYLGVGLQSPVGYLAVMDGLSWRVGNVNFYLDSDGSGKYIGVDANNTASAVFVRTARGEGAPTYAAEDGALYVDTVNPRIYARVGGVWRYASLI